MGEVFLSSSAAVRRSTSPPSNQPGSRRLGSLADMRARILLPQLAVALVVRIRTLTTLLKRKFSQKTAPAGAGMIASAKSAYYMWTLIKVMVEFDRKK